jgi:hypothetical protein
MGPLEGGKLGWSVCGVTVSWRASLETCVTGHLSFAWETSICETYNLLAPHHKPARLRTSLQTVHKMSTKIQKVIARQETKSVSGRTARTIH